MAGMTGVAETYLGIEIGGTKLQLVTGDADGRIARRWRAAVEPAAGGGGICRQILAGLEELRRGIMLRAMGVGFGGPVDFQCGRIRRSHQIDGWEGFDLRGWVGEQTGLPVALDNDANVAALAEARAGAGRAGPGASTDAADPLFYVTMGSGVGGGLVNGGRIYHGAPPGESEFGHLRLDRAGTIVESRCSGWAVDARIRKAIGDPGMTGPLATLVAQSPGNEARHLAEASRQGDAAARRILTEVGNDLAFALSHVVHLAHPRMIVLGGGLALVGEPLRAAVAAALAGYVMEAFAPMPDVCLAALREDAVPTGALILASALG